MKFMLMMHAPRGDGGYAVNDWSPDDFTAHIGFMKSYNAQLHETGEYVDAQGLAPPAQARLVRAGDGALPITDGPFAESKEFLVGYWIVDVPTEERALELAARASQAPGPGGRPLNMNIEVRQVMSGPPPVD